MPNNLNNKTIQNSKVLVTGGAGFIGSNIIEKLLKQNNDVALVWPFKDCVLEGGQTKEEDNREEIFFNEILAQDEITQLKEPKVLTNAKMYDKDGEHPFNAFTRNAELNKQR